jgi:hypothetical protein
VAAVVMFPQDLAAFATDIPVAKAEAMIEDALALAARVAPCILEPSFAHDKAAKAILRGAILRWHESGTGALSQEQGSIDDYSFNRIVDSRQKRGGLFWPSEIEALQDLCRTGEELSGAYTVDTVATQVSVHADICALRFGGLYCSCGAVLTMDLPLYENL